MRFSRTVQFATRLFATCDSYLHTPPYSPHCIQLAPPLSNSTLPTPHHSTFCTPKTSLQVQINNSYKDGKPISVNVDILDAPRTHEGPNATTDMRMPAPRGAIHVAIDTFDTLRRHEGPKATMVARIATCGNPILVTLDTFDELRLRRLAHKRKVVWTTSCMEPWNSTFKTGTLQGISPENLNESNTKTRHATIEVFDRELTSKPLGFGLKS